MPSYMITYDLNKPGQNYSELYRRIKAYGTWCHPVESTWFIKSSASAISIRDNLRSALDRNDQLIVAGLTPEAAWHGFENSVNNWIHANL